MSKRITLDDKFLFAGQAKYGITEQTQTKHAQVVDASITSVTNRLKNQEYGFVEMLSDNQMVDQILEMKKEFDWADYLVVIGIGGSDLGGRVINQVFGWNSKIKVLFHGDSPDPEALTRLLSQIDLQKTVFNVVSKSGTTLEIISQYVFLKHHLQDQIENWQDHFIFTTDAKVGLLRTEADQNSIKTLQVPDNVGGRFSVLSAVGLFPAAMMGADIRALLAGGSEFVTNSLEIAQALATTQFLLYQQEIPLVSIMPYSIQLEEFGRWFRQLWAESLGKNDMGVLPLQARGPADQHSQIQYYNQGLPLLSVLFIAITEPNSDYRLDSVDIKEVEYLRGHSLHEILNYEQKATAMAMQKAGRPNATLELDKLTESTLGALFVCFELAVVYLAEMLGVNAFDQPGVEAGKLFTYELMGKESAN